ncbi:nuclear factor NF3 [Cardiosporidium cionae]|uniref:Nuclear factor NF3 n=1 Tax=Cardiosporidium cionae TaxID=476202 RepID=A0ABQ7J9W7_9APIC|nr:nuclear factor NF3 [Cardiosporidium cionae]|eukprot:KAF8820792.1 nuclear factor NF3 [Cardiosporidium cionae]
MRISFKMFFGAHLKPNVPFVPTRKDGGDLLHLSQLCLYNPKQAGRTYVQVVEGNETYCVASLEKDKMEQVSIDLFLSTENELKLQTTGASNEVHVVGFFEPEPSDLEDEDDFQGNILSKKRQATGRAEKDKGKARRRNAESDDEDELSNETTDAYQLALVQYLKAHGKTNIGLLGSKVKKPAELSERLGAFIKNRPTVFKIEEGSVILVE